METEAEHDTEHHTAEEGTALLNQPELDNQQIPGQTVAPDDNLKAPPQYAPQPVAYPATVPYQPQMAGQPVVFAATTPYATTPYVLPDKRKVRAKNALIVSIVLCVFSIITFGLGLFLTIPALLLALMAYLELNKPTPSDTIYQVGFTLSVTLSTIASILYALCTLALVGYGATIITIVAIFSSY